MSDTYVQVMPLIERDGAIIWTTTDNAEFFGIYVGRPGDFQWRVDIEGRENAMTIARGVAASESIPPENVYLLGEEA